ncbi:MAG: hypothetical protein ACLPV4_04380 [Solirubrobacteraceae bacterium]
MRLSTTHEKYRATVKIVHIVVGIACIVLVGAAMLWGAWCWHRHQQSRLFWRLLRAGQVAVVLEVAIGGVLVALGKKESSLHLIYGLLPLAVSFLGEQLRISSAQAILDQRGLESAAAVGQLPDEEQQDVVAAIIQRELGVMVLTALVVFALLIRAAGTGG